MKPVTNAKPLTNADGYSFLEILVVVAIMAVLYAVAAPGIGNMLQQSKSDGAISTTLNALRVGRDRAIGERRNFEVRFSTPNRIQIARVDIPGPGTTVVSDTYLENSEFLEISGVGDTPDKFGLTNAPIAFGTSPTRMFTSEGTFVDSTGDVLNGTLFIATRGQGATSARAVTILGSTALLHAWRYDGKQWVD